MNIFILILIISILFIQKIINVYFLRAIYQISHSIINFSYTFLEFFRRSSLLHDTLILLHTINILQKVRI